MAPAFTTTSLAFIDGLGGGEMLLIFFVVLLLFGGQKLPEFARGLGKSIREFKKASAGVEEEIKRALAEPPPKPIYQPLPTVEPERNYDAVPHPNETLHDSPQPLADDDPHKGLPGYDPSVEKPTPPAAPPETPPEKPKA